MTEAVPGLANFSYAPTAKLGASITYWVPGPAAGQVSLYPLL